MTRSENLCIIDTVWLLKLLFFPVSFLYINLPFQALSLILYIWTMLQAKNKNKDINKSKQTKKINNQATNRCILNSLTKVHFTRNASSTYHLTYFIPLESLFHLNVNLWEETCANKSFLKWGDSFKPIGWDMGRGLGDRHRKCCQTSEIVKSVWGWALNGLLPRCVSSTLRDTALYSL